MLLLRVAVERDQTRDGGYAGDKPDVERNTVVMQQAQKRNGNARDELEEIKLVEYGELALFVIIHFHVNADIFYLLR